MPKCLSYAEAVHAYATGATIWCVHSNGQTYGGLFWDEPRERFADPRVRRDAARACARRLRILLTYEDPGMSFYISQ